MSEPENTEPETPEFPFEWMPLAVGEIEIVGWDGHSYVDRTGRTYWSGQEPSAADAADAVTTPRAVPTARRQRTRTILERLTPTELAALHAAKQSSAAVDAFVLKASIEGVISEADADFAAGRAALDAAGIIAAARWEELFA